MIKRLPDFPHGMSQSDVPLPLILFRNRKCDIEHAFLKGRAESRGLALPLCPGLLDFRTVQVIFHFPGIGLGIRYHPA